MSKKKKSWEDDGLYDETVEPEVEVEETPPQSIIKVRSLIEANLEYTGRESGQLYRWHGAGQVTPVRAEDVPELLSKQLGKKSCCGGENRIFELAQEA